MCKCFWHMPPAAVNKALSYILFFVDATRPVLFKEIKDYNLDSTQVQI